MKGKQILSWAPEIVLIAEVLFYWLSSSPLNPFAMIFLAILASIVIFKNKTIGVVTAILFLLLNLYMCLALLSELREFPSWTNNAKLLLLVGGTMFLIGIIASTAMIIKWGRRFSIVQTSN